MIDDLEAFFGSLPDASGLLSGITSGLGAATAALRSFAQQQDAANNGLKQGRDEFGRFTKAGQGAASPLERFGASAKGIVPTITALSATIVSLASGPLPSATQAMQAFGALLGGAVTGGAHLAAQALSRLGPEGAAAGAAIEGMAAVFAATIGVLATLAGTAVEVTEKLDLMRARFDGLAGSAAGGKAMTDMVMRLGQQLPFATDQVAAWAQKLEMAGVKGQALERDIKAVASAAAFGDDVAAGAQNLFRRIGEGGEAAKKFLEEIQKGGTHSDRLLKQAGLSMEALGGKAAVAKMSVDQLHDAIAAALQTKGAKALGVLANGWSNIIQKAREGFLSLFDELGPAVEPFMKEVKGLFSEFSKGGVVINTLKPIVTAVFSTLFAWGTKALNAVHRGLLQVVIFGLQAYIWLKNNATAVAVLSMAWNGIVAALKVVGVIVAVLAGLVVGLTVIWGVLVGVLVMVGSTILGVLSEAFDALTDWATDAASAAADFVAGLVQGIAAGAGAVADAVSNLAKGALGAFRGVFQMHSPSRVMTEDGEHNIAGAAATGVERGADKMDAAMERLGPKPSAKGRGATSGAPSSGGSSREISFNNCNFFGTTEDKIRALITMVLQQEAGGGPEPEAG